jgi:Phage capsid family
MIPGESLPGQANSPQVLAGLRGHAMNKPALVPEDITRRTTRPSVYAVRAGAATLRAFMNGQTPVNAARSMFGDDHITEIILRAATAPAATGVSAWAKEIAGLAIYDLIQATTSLSAGAEIISRALKLNMDGVAELRVPGRTVSAAAAGQWVAEGQPTPVRALNFSDAAILRPRRLSIISVYTQEMAQSSNIEAIVRQTLGEATGLALDAQMFSASAGDASKPPGLFAGTAALTPTAGGGDNAMHGDIAALFGALAANAGGKTAVIVAALPQAIRLKMSVGPKFDYDILSSTALAAGTVAVIELASFVSGFESLAEFNVSKVAAVHMEADTPTDITGGSPSPAVPVRSLFQIDAIALKMRLQAAWGMRASHVAFLTGATW